MNGWLWNVINSVYITIGLFIIDYRTNLLDNIDNIIPVIGKTWWTRFYKLHQNKLLYGENVLDENDLCDIIEGDWKWLDVKLEYTYEKNIR